MRNSSLLIVLCLMLSVLAATSGCTTIKADAARLWNFITQNQAVVDMELSSVSSAAALKAVTSKKITPATAAKVVTALQTTLTTVQAVQTPGSIAGTLTPVINAQLAKVIADPMELTVAESAVSAALNEVQSYLNAKYPVSTSTQPASTSTSNQAAVEAMVTDVIQGVIQGLNNGITAVNTPAATSQPATK